MGNRNPARLDARPSVRAAWLQWRNLWGRWPLPAGAMVCAFVALGALGRIRAVVYVLALAALSRWFVLSATTVLTAFLALRHQRRLERNGHRHWLAALPSDLSPTARTAARALAAWLVAAALIVLLSLVAHLPAWVPVRLTGYSAGAVALGVTLAAAMAAAGARRRRSGRSSDALAHSRYTAARRTRPGRAHQVTLAPLGEWPLAAARFRDRPTIRARSLLLLLLAVPMNVRGGAALAAAAAWLLGLHLINLLLAQARTALSAAWWLAPTPLRPLRFAVALVHRMLGAQLLACAALIAIAYVTLGVGSLRTAGALAGLWLALAGVLGMAAGVFALRTRSIAASPLHRWRR